MKKITTLVLIAIALSVYSQQPLFVNQQPDSVVRVDHRLSKMMYEPGEILVRFHDDVAVNIYKSGGKAQTGNASVDDILIKFDVREAEKLIKDAEPLKTKQLLRTFTGLEFEQPSLHNIYLLKTEKDQREIFELIEALKEDNNVMYAEPNYIYSLVGHEALSGVLTAGDLKSMSGSKPQNKSSKNVITPNDPFYSQQWWIQAINADQAWTLSTGDTNQVIAILDTGVDWQHPDLQNKIWRNNDEVLNGQDSDGNGFVDDIRGWDFINNDNNPMDDNSHGTHVAGIAAAEANNGIGIAGVSWGAKIMPVKVLQSSGYGTAAKIIQGIAYAANNGATVINMSFGSYARSIAMENALANAYASCVLVAAAGNDDINIGPCFGCAPFFPAALSFVLGVEATQQNPYNGLNPCKLGTYLAGFSNYDCDGPTYSNYTELWNYEIKAPGTTLISTIPGGNYKVYQGTSMAAPVVAASASIFRSIFPVMSQELMWVKLIQSVGNHFNLYNSLTAEVYPEVRMIEHTIVDTIYDGDRDGRPDAGETLQLWLKMKNTGSQADSVYAGIRFAPFEDTTTAQILVPKAFIGSISPYATRTNQFNPLVIKIDSNVVHDRHVMFEGWTTFYPYQDTSWQSVQLVTEKGIELGGFITDDIVLYADKIYLVTENVVINSGTTMTISPGTKLHFFHNKSLAVLGNIIAHGTPDSLIEFLPNNDFWSGISLSGIGTISFDFCKIEGTRGNLTPIINVASYTSFATINNSIFLFNTNISGSPLLSIGGHNSGLETNFFGIIKHCNLFNNYATFGVLGGARFRYEERQLCHNNIINNKALSQSPSYLVHTHSNNYPDNISIGNCFNNHIDSGKEINITAYSASFNIIAIPKLYFGTSDENRVQDYIWDYFDDPMLPMINYQKWSFTPDSLAHGIVWKVLVNGADAQDEYVEPVGVGAQRFDVYFNREMDLNYPPQLTFGVRAPYTQHAVADSGYWSEDHKIWTAWKTMQIYTGDGINRIRVAGARDLEGFEIPIEDMRFEFLIDAAGSASTDFTATPGMGRVFLEWSYPEGVEDVLGYNIYRFQHTTDTTFTAPLMINQTLVLDTLYTDFEVLPGTKYYYYYKILRTNLAETDSSRIVNCTPHTAAPGDANGDYNVDIMDIITIVSFMLNQNPQPFIFEAADINGDGIINVIDITGVVIIINTQTRSYIGGQDPVPAYLYLENDLIRLRSKGQLTALQFELKTDNPEAIQLKSLVPGFEFAWSITEGGIIGIMYNLNLQALPTGFTDLISISGSGQALKWVEALGADQQGRKVKLITSGEQLYTPPAYGIAAYPNPVRNHLTVSYDLPVEAEVQVSLYDLFGRKLSTIAANRQMQGNHIHHLDLSGLNIGSGMILCHIHAQGNDGSHFNKSLKVMVISNR